MSVFDPITLEWAGRAYTIPAYKVLGAIARIEDIVTMQELAQYAQRSVVPLAKIAKAYGAVLRYAGASVEDDDVYAGMFATGTAQVAVAAAVSGLLVMSVPPAARKSANPGNGRSAGPSDAARSSKTPTRQSSAKVGH